MNWLDGVIVAVAILLGLVGLWKGAIKAIFGLAGLAGGIALAGHFYSMLAMRLSPQGAIWAGIAAYAIILIATVVVASIIGWFVARMVHALPFSWVDRLVGFILGAFIGSILCAAAVAIVCRYFPGTKEMVSQTVIAKFLVEQFPLLLALLPNDFFR